MLSKIDNSYLKSVNNLSIKNVGSTGVNPSVACLVVDFSQNNNGIVLSYGLTSHLGRPHAEINALNNLKKKQISKKTSLYVSLEPCYKLSKCCAMSIVNSNIRRVVISSKDPNPIIYQQGISFLKKNNIKVILANISLDKFSHYNQYFYLYHKNHRPFITLKIAVSQNGYSKDFKNKDITSAETQYFMHKYRLRHDAIAVGYNTYTHDKPKLTCRLNGLYKKTPQFVFSSKPKIISDNKFIVLTSTKDLKLFLSNISKKNIKSILIEGGASTFNFFFNNDFFDQILLCKSQKKIIKSKKRYQINQNLIKKRCKLESSIHYHEDTVEIYKK